MGTPISYLSGNTGSYTKWNHNQAQVNLNLNEKLAPYYNWWNGVDISSQYLLYSDTNTQGQATIVNSRPTAWTTPDLNDSSLLLLVNTLLDMVGKPQFTDVNIALNFLQATNKYFLLKYGYENIKSNPTMSLDAGWSTSFIGLSINVVAVRCYSVYNGSLRSANYHVQYSDNGSSWTTAFTGVMSNFSLCGNVMGSGVGNGSYGSHRYWRYVEGSPVVSHHPRCARIDLIDTNGFIYNLITYNVDNCTDIGQYIIGTVSKDFAQWTDLSGNGNNGTLTNGPTFSSISQGAIVFDGTDDYVVVTPPSTIPLNDYAMEVWFNIAALPSKRQYLIDPRGNGGENNSPIYFLFDDNGSQIKLTGGNSGIEVLSDFISVQTNTWYHAVCTRIGSTCTLYFNGVKVGEGNTGSSTLSITYPFRIATYAGASSGQYFFNGRMSMARLYSTGLTGAQVQNNYNTQKNRFGLLSVVQSGLTSSFDAGNYLSYSATGTTVKDLSPWKADFTLTNGPTWSSSNGGYFTFDGTDDYMITSAGAPFYNYTNQLSVSWWVKRNGTITGGAGGGQSTFNLDSTSTNVWLMHGNTDNTFIFYVNNSGSWVSIGTPILTDNTWYHIGVTVSSSATKMYINGSLYNFTSGVSQITVNPNSIIGWGLDPRYGTGRFFNGQIANAQVYNRELSASEILQNYQAHVILDGSTSDKAAPSAKYLWNNGVTTNGLYYIRTSAGVAQIYCDFTTLDQDGTSGWMHVGTISDNGGASNDPATMPWGYPLNPAQDTGIWQDTNTLNENSPSLTTNYKNRIYYSSPFTQLLIKDQGATQRNLLFTNKGQIKTNNSSLASWFGSLLWAAQGSENSNSAYQNGRVTGLAITNFGVSDPVLESGNKSILLFKFGEADGQQDGNKDRAMISWSRWDAADNVDAPAGIGAFTNRGGTIDYRNVVPYEQRSDFPPSTITGGPYNYSLWIK